MEAAARGAVTGNAYLLGPLLNAVGVQPAWVSAARVPADRVYDARRANNHVTVTIEDVRSRLIAAGGVHAQKSMPLSEVRVANVPVGVYAGRGYQYLLRHRGSRFRHADLPSPQLIAEGVVLADARAARRGLPVPYDVEMPDALAATAVA